ncbi:MAG: OmpA family protein [Halobacteria archaeon]|nr:OmpA family protein [Halobacteria archaeon]
MKSALLIKHTTLALLVAGLIGCTTTNPYTRDQEVSKATKGAGIGAVAGAVVGAISGDDSKERRKRALIGAGVGALAGGGIGYYMDVQEKKLRDQLEGTGVSVTRVGNEIILNMPGNITFATDSANINANFYDVLNSVTLVLKEFEKTVIIVAGHTDSTGSDSYNQQLSERRAGSVAQYLRSQAISDMRVIVEGYGESRPIASNDTSQGRQMNRRVELTLSPITQ